MTTTTDIVNKALTLVGLQKQISSLNQDSAEAKIANLLIYNVRRRLLRMAPWNCAVKTVNLVYITSAPGTPENTSAPTTLWQPGQPAPPWGYEYQYPVDCLRALWIIPATQTGFAGGIPITTAVTGGAASFWQGPPVKFKVQNDTFLPVTAAAVVAGGSGYNVGDILNGPGALINGTAPIQGGVPPGGPVQLQVATKSGGAVLTVNVLPQVTSSNATPASPIIGGSYFAALPNPVATTAATGNGSGATFNLTYGVAAPQRVILTNQEFAICAYVQDVSDPDLMDDQFIDAWAKALGAEITIPLTGDKDIANLAIQEVNQAIALARTGDGNEGFTVNDVTPDWIRIRGVDFSTPYSGPYTGFDWGGMYPIFG